MNETNNPKKKKNLKRFTVISLVVAGVLIASGIALAVSYFSLDRTVDSEITVVTSGGGGGGATAYELTLVVEPEGAGTVTGGGFYTNGQTVEITATANTNWKFVNWTLTSGDAAIADANLATTTVTTSSTATTITAHFAAVQEAKLYTEPIYTAEYELPAGILSLGSIAKSGSYQVTLYFNPAEIDYNTVAISDIVVPAGFTIDTFNASDTGTITFLVHANSEIADGVKSFSFRITGEGSTP